MNIEEEYLHGSPLDHKHCVNCVRRSCNVRVDDTTSCPSVECQRGCGSRYHGCKEAEHRGLCPEERVACINSGYGCPLLLPRKRLSHHLNVCPASVIFCSAEWNRSPMDAVQPGEKASVLLKKINTDCGQLDTAQAMRDHRALVDMLLAPSQTRRSLRNPLTQIFPAAPLGRPSSSASSETDASNDAASDLAGEGDITVWDSTQSWLAIQKDRYKAQSDLYEASRETASSLTSTLNYISDRMDSKDNGTSGETGGEATSPGSLSTADSVPNGSAMGSTAVSSDTHDAKSLLTSTPHPTTTPMQRCSDDSGLATGSVKLSISGQDKTGCEKRETEVRDREALNSLLSVSMEVECITKYQPKPNNTYTFLCAQEMRREEFPHHFHIVHNRILPDLNSWIEQRCPLAYLGCPFSFRRFRPSTPGLTLCHSWLLDSYGVTTCSSHEDPLHRIPSHLMPTHPETCGVETSATVRPVTSRTDGTANGQDREESGLAASISEPSQPAAQISSTGEDDDRSKHQLAGEVEQKYNAESGALASDISDAKSLSTAPQENKEENPVKEESFSALLDSINLEQEAGHPAVPSTEKKKKYLDHQGNDLDPSALDGVKKDLKVEPSGTESNHGTAEASPGVDSVENTQGKSQPVTSTSGGNKPRAHIHNSFIHSDETGSKGEKGKAVDRAAQHSSPETSPAEHSPPDVACSSKGDRRQVIYTATGPNTCVRVHWVPLAPHCDSGTGSKTQLCDLPVEILRHVAQFLDSFSLCNLSLVSRGMRDLCCSLLTDRGMVSLLWERQRRAGKVSWHVAGKRWSFSTCFERVDSWSFTGHNPISDHLVTCPYNQDRFRHLSKFSIIPLTQAPMDSQIRDMLQERINRRRPAGRPRWYIAAMKLYVERLCQHE